MDNYYLSGNAEDGYTNDCASQSNQYTHHQTGSLQSFDFNISANVGDRVFLGATFGVDNVDYRSWSDYAEYGDGNYSLYEDCSIEGVGMNLKLGAIVRPIADNPLRLGITMETPTWYRLSNSTVFALDASDQIESYLDYNVSTPWKGRLSLGTTFGTRVALGAEYEFANYAKTRMGYPIYDTFGQSAQLMAGITDVAMNAQTAATLKWQHTLKLGVEYKPTNALALRAGYNIATSRYRDGATYDQYNIDSSAMNYATGTSYMTLGAVNIVTLGAGYKFRKFYVDVAYKFRAQQADFYAFDTTGLNGSLDPVSVNLNRHQLVASLGFKF